MKNVNNLKVENLNKFLEQMASRDDYYRMPFEILADLQKQIKYAEVPEKIILIEYKNFGDCIFEFVKKYTNSQNQTFFVYEFNSTVS